MQQAEIGGRVASHRLAASRDCKTAKRIEPRPQRPRALMCRESSSCTCFWNSRSFAISSTIVSLDSRSRTSCAQRSDQRWLLSCSSFTVATRVASSTPLTGDAIGLRSRRRSRSWRVSLCAGMGWRAPPTVPSARHCKQTLRSCWQSRRGIREIPAHDGPPRRWRPNATADQPLPRGTQRCSLHVCSAAIARAWPRAAARRLTTAVFAKADPEKPLCKVS